MPEHTRTSHNLFVKYQGIAARFGADSREAKAAWRAYRSAVRRDKKRGA